jgi:hypothetical protein
LRNNVHAIIAAKKSILTKTSSHQRVANTYRYQVRRGRKSTAVKQGRLTKRQGDSGDGEVKKNSSQEEILLEGCGLRAMVTHESVHAITGNRTSHYTIKKQPIIFVRLEPSFNHMRSASPQSNVEVVSREELWEREKR